MPRTIAMKIEYFSFTKRATQITHLFGAYQYIKEEAECLRHHFSVRKPAVWFRMLLRWVV